jgi:hypothetical protein
MDCTTSVKCARDSLTRHLDVNLPYISQLVRIRRCLAKNFTQIPNDLIRNPNLSSKSLGVIVYLLSLPPGFRISLKGLCKARKEGEAAMRTAIQELERLNYMMIVHERSNSGRFIGSRWIVSDEPIMNWAQYLENPVVDGQVLENPVMEGQRHTNTEVLEKSTNLKTTTDSQLDSLPQLCEINHGLDQEIWLWLCQTLAIEPEKARQDCEGLSAAMAMDILAEVIECKRQGTVRTTASQFLFSMLHKARKGKFKLSAGTALRKDIPRLIQQQKALQAIAPKSTLPAEDELVMGIEQRREKLRQLRETLLSPPRRAR